MTTNYLLTALRFDPDMNAHYYYQDLGKTFNKLPPARPSTTIQESTMHKSMSVFLISDVVRMITCSYDPPEREGGPVKKYFFKTLDQTIEAKDLVVVPTNTRHGFTVMKVEEVDVEFDIEEMNFEVLWVVDKVDTTEYDNLLGQEKGMLKKAAQTRQRKMKEKLRSEIFDADDEELVKLPLYHQEDEVASPTPPPGASRPDTIADAADVEEPL